MFDSVILRRSENDRPISAGQIAEVLLFYRRVHLFIDYETLIGLIRQIGTKHVLNLLNRAEVTAVYCEEILATQTTLVGITPCHDYGIITMVGHQDEGTFRSPLERLRYRLGRLGIIEKTEVVRFSKAFLKLAPVRKFSGGHFHTDSITDAARNDLLNEEYIKQAIRASVAITPGGYIIGEDFEFEIIKTELGIFVFTNINFESINYRRSQTVPPLEPLTLARLLGNILSARADLTLASFYGGDFITSDITSSIIQVKYAELLRRTELNLDSRQEFKQIILPDSPCLAEVIDSKERSFDEFLILLDHHAPKFKYWVNGVNPDEGLIRSYITECSSTGWLQKLRGKILRYSFTTGMGLLNPIAGVVSGLVNEFIIDKLFTGWRPNHFVEHRLSHFIKGYHDKT
ncbi:MAG: hypothetical protein Q8L97_06080 [Nitrosomonas sp.]|uniref:hypothetical protein n=1 Tax=Nitrosomonas sp. TaxID=42353 RepID=UPI00272F0395|nr:hypothetical protein [Nitrosomonas sp.]MDP1549713.1 hypothetical protein [Nitrosomonas sp.]